MATPSLTQQHAVDADRQAPEIWSLQEIADFYRRSVRQAARIVRDAEFPRPLRGDRHRWVAADVIAFAVSFDHGAEGHLSHSKTTGNVRRISRSRPVRATGALS